MTSSPLSFCSHCGAANSDQATQCFACNQPLHASPTELLLKERYRAVGQLGQGGMGSVYQAEDIKLGNRMVAIKVMSQRGLTEQETKEATEAFKQEAMMLAVLLHPHLPRIYDHFSENGRWYLVMDFIAGETLEHYLVQQPGKHLPLQEALEYGIQLCTVLDYLHTRQPPIVFRDLKPSNIIRTNDGQLYLVDFGIARHFKPGQLRDTIAFGSPGYAAPEQYGKVQTMPSADIYSLGALLHQMLTGNDPSVTPFFFAPLSTSDGPYALQKLLKEMLTMDANNRPISAMIVKQELQSIAMQENMRQLSSPPTPARKKYNIPSSRPITAQKPAALAPSPASSPHIPIPATPIKPLTPPLPSQNVRGTRICIYNRHIDRVTAIAWSPDGRRVASASYDKTVQIWNAVTAEMQQLYEGEHPSRIYTLGWSPHNRIASAGEGKLIQLWNADPPRELSFYSKHTASVLCLAWSPSGAQIASTSGKAFHIWKAPTWTTIASYNEHEGIIQAVAWSPDSLHVAGGGSDGKLYIYATNKPLSERSQTVYSHRGAIYAVAWSPDGRSVASASEDKRVRIWDAATATLNFIYTGHTGPVKTVAWSPDGTLIASGGEDETIQIWDATGKKLFTYINHYAPIYALAWSPDGTRIASSDARGFVQVWIAR